MKMLPYKRFANCILLFLLGLSFFSADAQSKDTLRVMTYNVMYYRQNTSFCTTSNNNPNTKENALEIIIDYTLPDVLVCNEIGGHSSGLNAFTLMNSSLNKNGRSYYQMAAPSGSFLVNMLYFNSNKLALYSQDIITQELNGSSLVRPIDVYTLYFKDPNLAIHGDTTFMTFLAAHLKAGNTSGDATERANATAAVMSYLSAKNATGNYFFLGDLNLYNSNESAFQNLINHSVPSQNFSDPVGVPGNWGGSQYAILHTQSTHTSGACFSGGGMDDRFDFILASDEVMNNTDKVKYISNSYWAVGQDGMRYNSTIKSPTNNSVPFFVANALYDLSDHLPVQLDVEITLPATSGLAANTTDFDFSYTNPVQDELRVLVSDENSRISELKVKSMSGQLIRGYQGNGGLEQKLNLGDLSPGIYLLELKTIDDQIRVKKLIKN